MGLFLPSEIARLVLGYLEEENCEKAYEEFLSSSPHLQECRESNRNLGFFSIGCSLVDILEDYSAVNNFVLNFHSSKPLRRQISKCHSLLEKVKFVCKRNDASFEENRNDDVNRLSNCNNSEKNSLGSRGDFSFNVNTTPASELSGHIPTSSKRDDSQLNKNILSCSQIDESLPSKEVKKILDKSVVSEDGRNSVEEAAFKKALGLVKLTDVTDKSIQVKTPTKRKVLKYKGSQSARKLTDVADSFSNESINVTAITSALLDYTELHEKIAENINNLIASTSIIKSNEKNSFTDNGTLGDQNNVPFLIEDETTQMNNVIKSIVDKTEKDPLFDQFLNNVLDNIAPVESTSGTDSDSISRPETSTPEKSAPSFAGDSSPTPMNSFLLNDESYRSFNKKSSYSKDRSKYSKGKSFKNFTDELHVKSSNQPKFPRLSRGGKRMDLLKENYKKSELSDLSNDNSLDSTSNDNTIISIPLDPEPTPIIVEPVVQEKLEKPGKVKIISDEEVQTNVTDKGNLIIQKGSVTEVANFKPIQIIESYPITAPMSDNLNAKPLFIADPGSSGINIESTETMKISSIPISDPPMDNTKKLLAFRKYKVKPSDLILPIEKPCIDTKSNVFDKNNLQPCNIVTPLPLVVPGTFVDTAKPQFKPIDDVRPIPKIQPGPFDSIIIIDNPGININNPQEIISKVPVLSLPENTQISIKTPNAPTNNNLSNSGARKSASHVRVLDFNDAKRESKKELVKKAFMSPIRIMESNNNKKSPLTKTKILTVEHSPISVLNKDINKIETTALSDVWSDTLGLNQIIKPPAYSSWDAKIRAAAQPNIESEITKKRPKKVKTYNSKKKETIKKTTEKSHSVKKNEKNTKTKKQTVAKIDHVNIDDKPITSTTNLEKGEGTTIAKKDLYIVEPKIIQKKHEPIPTSSKSIPSAEKLKVQTISSVFSMNTLLETPIKPGFFDISINTPKFLNDKSVSISAIKIDEITTPFFKKTPDGLIASLFGTPGTGSTICTTDYSSSSSYYKPDEIEDIYFEKDDGNEPNKTMIVKDPSPKKDTELEKENLSDRVLRPRRKSTKFANYITTSSKNVGKTTSPRKSRLSKSSDSEKSFLSSNESSFSKTSCQSKSKDKNSNKPLKPKDEPENRLNAKDDDSKKISPQTHKQLLSEKANRVKSKLNTVKPTIFKPPKGILNKIISQNRRTKSNSTVSKKKTTSDKKTLDLRTKEVLEACPVNNQKSSNSNPSSLPPKSRRKSSTPRKLEKVDNSVSPQTKTVASPPKKTKKEDESAKNIVNLHCEEHFPTLNINMYSSENGDSEDDLTGVQKFVQDIKVSKSSETLNNTEESIQKDLIDTGVEKTKNDESSSNEMSLDENNLIIWSEYDINSSHPKYIKASYDNKHQRKKLTDAQRREIHNYVLNAGIFNTLHDCDEERAIGVSDILSIFEMQPGYRSKHTEKRKRESTNDEQASKTSKPGASGLQLLMNELNKSENANHDESLNTKAEKELNVAIESIMVVDEEVNLKDLGMESPKKTPEEKKNESTPDISSSKKLLTHFGIDSVLSMLHGPDEC